MFQYVYFPFVLQNAREIISAFFHDKKDLDY